MIAVTDPAAVGVFAVGTPFLLLAPFAVATLAHRVRRRITSRFGDDR